MILYNIELLEFFLLFQSYKNDTLGYNLHHFITYFRIIILFNTHLFNIMYLYHHQDKVVVFFITYNDL